MKGNVDINQRKIKNFLKITICVAILARIMNFGWFTILMFLTANLPLHIWAFYSINMKLSKYVSRIKFSDFLIIISSITFLLPYILYPDYGDVGGAYAVFGRVRNEMIIETLKKASIGILIFNFFILLIELGIYFNLKKKDNSSKKI